MKLLKKLFGKKSPAVDDAVVIARAAHTISRQRISKNALKVLGRLNDCGYEAYLVGGGVRDLLVDGQPKDFDIATDAKPEQVRKIFKNSLLIGRRFKLVHVRFGRDIIEVATFRGEGRKRNKNRRLSDAGMIMRDNVYGNRRDDAYRRDFTVNALYYSIADFSVIDYTNGMDDIKHRLIRVIGDAKTRYHEDPVRMLRAVRLSAKLDFSIEKETEQPIFELGGLLQNIAPSRLFEETLKIFYCGKANIAFDMLRHYGLFAIIFPQVEAMLIGEEGERTLILLERAFRNTDVRIQEGKSLNPAFIFAVLLWSPLQQLCEEYESSGMKRYPAMRAAMDEVLLRQAKSVSIPKRFTSMIREIWMLQFELPRRFGKRVYRCLYHPRFRAAYDFLLVRAESGEQVDDLAKWWTVFQTADSEKKQQLLSKVPRQRERH